MMTLDPDLFARVLNGHSDPPITLVDWKTAYSRPPDDHIVEGLIFPGRWTAINSPAKMGKSTLLLHIGHSLARGLDPFTGTPQTAMDVLYLDGEMGETDTVERLQALELAPCDLARFHYTDIGPKGDTLQGGTAIISTANLLDAAVIILDGMNAFVSGAEKDDTPWRNLFEHTIAPLKRSGRAVLSSDNTGKDITLSARGSSVKLDKADAIITLKRTDDGVNLKTTHQRTSSYLRSLDLAVTGSEGEQPISYRRIEGSWPAGTKEAAELLERLGVPLNDGRRKVRETLRAAGESLSNDVMCAAIRHRKVIRGSLFGEATDHSNGSLDENDF